MKALENFRGNLAHLVRSRANPDGQLSVAEIAVRSGLSRAYVHRVTYGEVEPTITVCDRIADALGHPLERLLQPPRKRARRLGAPAA